jgi:hypothetical protein
MTRHPGNFDGAPRRHHNLDGAPRRHHNLDGAPRRPAAFVVHRYGVRASRNAREGLHHD